MESEFSRISPVFGGSFVVPPNGPRMAKCHNVIFPFFGPSRLDLHSVRLEVLNEDVL